MTSMTPDVIEVYANLLEQHHSILEDVWAHYSEDLPNECVGLIWGDGEISRLINQARSPRRFSVSLPQLAEVLGRREGTILAVYHSHPGGTTGLSVDDQESIRFQFEKDLPIPWLVITEDVAMLWYLGEDGEIRNRKLALREKALTSMAETD